MPYPKLRLLQLMMMMMMMMMMRGRRRNVKTIVFAPTQGKPRAVPETP